MGAKPSTANGTQSPRTRAFSTSSSSEVVTAPGFRFMRSLGMDMSNDRQRARSLSSVPDLHASHEALSLPPTGASFDVSTGASPETDSSSAEEAASVLGLGSTAANIALGRVYAAHSLPSHIWSLNDCLSMGQSLSYHSNVNSSANKERGIKCPVCSKFVIPDDIECHLVMCLTKPRLSYNEDVLTDDKGECVICLEELCKGDVIARLPCLCIYHKTCIDQWFDVNRSCPEHPGD
ncbi:uncharacterized protein isoform X2 [Leptinotarsa decemlineata]|uniref:uncharacterized protein isoform X2 n=1 Tax=Leptinotarsa decemlineata TaxID=7539 RepID=UPI003D305F8B